MIYWTEDMLLSKNEYLYLKYSIINRIFMENRETICRKFLKDPSIDPKDGHRLQRGKGPYMKYVKLCQNLGFDKEVDELLGTTIIIKSPRKHQTLPIQGITD